MQTISSLPIEYVETQSIYSDIVKRGYGSVLFCSSDPGEGVSTVAYAVAQKAVSSGKKTLLIEFTTQNSYLGDQLGLPTLSWCLDTLPSAEELTAYSPSGLMYLPAPKSKNFPVSSRQSTKVETALTYFQQSFDLVVVDAPPVCRPNLHGIPTQMLAPQVDGAFLIVSTNKTGQNQIKRSVEILTNQGTAFAGAILNDQTYPSLYREIGRQFEKGGGIGKWAWAKVQKPLQNAPFMTDNF